MIKSLNQCVNGTGFPLALQTGPLRWRYALSSIHKDYESMRICCALITMFFAIYAAAEDTCRVNFGDKIYKEDSSFVYEAYLSTDTSSAKDFDQYPTCKEFCESAEFFQAKKIKNGCILYGDDIEKSKYKDIYLSTLSKRCETYHAHDLNFFIRHNPFSEFPASDLFGHTTSLLASKELCQESIKNNYGCISENSSGCVAIYGKNANSLGSKLYATLILYKYYLLVIIVTILVLLYGIFLAIQSFGRVRAARPA